MNVSAWSIRNPIPAILLFALLAFMGTLSFMAMKVQQFMDLDLPSVRVTASLPGAAPALLETEVARKIENAIATLQGLKHIYTKVQDGTATITAEFRLEKPTQEAAERARVLIASHPQVRLVYTTIGGGSAGSDPFMSTGAQEVRKATLTHQSHAAPRASGYEQTVHRTRAARGPDRHPRYPVHRGSGRGQREVHPGAGQ